MDLELEKRIDGIVEAVENSVEWNSNVEHRLRQEIRDLWKERRPGEVTLEAIEEIVTNAIFRRFGPTSADKTASCPNSAENPSS